LLFLRCVTDIRYGYIRDMPANLLRQLQFSRFYFKAYIIPRYTRSRLNMLSETVPLIKPRIIYVTRYVRCMVCSK